ncbi:MAG: NTP transferase domain-containing protein [Paracoccus sp. (in: a-proteobacteria)]|nr:NTP transferase domain-containing protein [Paracoccus sp. (in: a-proteobacteria)]
MSSQPKIRFFDSALRETVRDVATILLAGGKGTRLHDLTATDSKPAVPFAGRNRIVDFAMANAARSGIRHLLVATQFAPQTLHDYLPARWGQHFDRGGIMLRDGQSRYLGTADALRHNWPQIARSSSDEVLVLAADHVYDMDYAQMIRDHRHSGAVATVAVDIVPLAQASGFGVMQADSEGRIMSFLEKPAHPPAMAGHPDKALVSMGVYVFSRRWLENVLFDTHPDALDFGHDVIPLAVDRGLAAVYKLPAGPDGRTYWRDVGTLDALRMTQLDFVNASPARLPRPDPVSDWHLGQGSIAMMGAVVSHSASLTNTIVAPGTFVPPGLVTGHDPHEDALWFTRTPSGTVLITQAMLDRRAVMRIPRSRIRVAPSFDHSAHAKDKLHA